MKLFVFNRNHQGLPRGCHAHCLSSESFSIDNHRYQLPENSSTLSLKVSVCTYSAKCPHELFPGNVTSSPSPKSFQQAKGGGISAVSKEAGAWAGDELDSGAWRDGGVSAARFGLSVCPALCLPDPGMSYG